MRRGKTLKGSKHSCGFSTPHGDKNPAAILRNLLFHSSLARKPVFMAENIMQILSTTKTTHG